MLSEIYRGGVVEAFAESEEGPVYGEKGEDFVRICLHGGWDGAFADALELKEAGEEAGDATPNDATPSDATPNDATPSDAQDDDDVHWKLARMGENEDTEFTVDVTMGNVMSDEEFLDALDNAGLRIPDWADGEPVWLAEKGDFTSRIDLTDGEDYEIDPEKLVKDTKHFYAGWFETDSVEVATEKLTPDAVQAVVPNREKDKPQIRLQISDLEEQKTVEEISEALQEEGVEISSLEDTLQLDIGLAEDSADLGKDESVGFRIALPEKLSERAKEGKVEVIHFTKNGPQIEKSSYSEADGTVEFSMDSFSPVVIAVAGIAEGMARVTLENVPGGWSRAYETIEGDDGVRIQRYLPLGETVEVPAGTKLKLEADPIYPAEMDSFEIKNGDSEESCQDGDEYTVPSGEITITPVFQLKEEGSAEKRILDAEPYLAADAEPALYREQGGIRVEFYLTGGYKAGNPKSGYIDGLADVYVQSDAKFKDALEQLDVIPEMFGYDFMGWYVADTKVEDDEPVSEINNGWPAVETRFERDGKVYNPEIRTLGEEENPDGGDEGGEETPSIPDRPSGGRGGSRGSSSGSAYSGSEIYGDWQQDASGWRFKQTDGTYAANRWGKVNGAWYYFGADTYMETGWFSDGTNWYYLNPVSDGTRGAMKTGWVYDDSYGKWFYLSASGEMMTGWQLINGTYYYLNPISDGTRGAMASEQWIGDYYVGADGARVIGAAR